MGGQHGGRVEGKQSQMGKGKRGKGEKGEASTTLNHFCFFIEAVYIPIHRIGYDCILCTEASRIVVSTDVYDKCYLLSSHQSP